jgi:hypothetical protein
MLQREGGRMPNADLGAVARQSKRAGQSTVDTQAAAERMRTLFGEDEYQRVLAAAKGEGRFTQTAADALQNSSTAQQLGDMGMFGQLAQDAMTGGVGPGRLARMGGAVGEQVLKVVDEPANRRAAELMLGKPQTLLEMLEQLGQSDAARKAAVQPIAGAASRTGVARY